MEKEIKEQKAEKEGRCLNNTICERLWLPFLGSSVITMCCCS